jgi:hypothetical protein
MFFQYVAVPRPQDSGGVPVERCPSFGQGRNRFGNPTEVWSHPFFQNGSLMFLVGQMSPNMSVQVTARAELL